MYIKIFESKFEIFWIWKNIFPKLESHGLEIWKSKLKPISWESLKKRWRVKTIYSCCLQKEELVNTHINIGWYQDWYPWPNQVVMTRGNNTLILDLSNNYCYLDIRFFQYQVRRFSQNFEIWFTCRVSVFFFPDF